MFKTNNLDINNEIFQEDLLLPLLFYVALISLSIELKNTENGYKSTTEIIDHQFYMHDYLQKMMII